MSQHGSLTLDRWKRFTVDQRILMIANEMHRAGGLASDSDSGRRSHAYERVLALADLTIQAAYRRPLRREMLRWRDTVAELYLSPTADAVAHRAAFTCLLRFTPEAAQQLTALAPPGGREP
jgi:hypothetical protein